MLVRRRWCRIPKQTLCLYHFCAYDMSIKLVYVNLHRVVVYIIYIQLFHTILCYHKIHQSNTIVFPYTAEMK